MFIIEAIALTALATAALPVAIATTVTVAPIALLFLI